MKKLSAETKDKIYGFTSCLIAALALMALISMSFIY